MHEREGEVMDRNNWPSPYDSIRAEPGDPVGWHVRELTPGGHPVMGSSPAERLEAAQRAERIRQQAMRDHPFEGDGPYCRAWQGPTFSGSPEVGVVTMRIRCGYPPDTHPGATT
jgi:hypothetical protein